MKRHRWRRIASFVVPLLGRQKAADINRAAYEKAKADAIKKPGRKLGAVWIDRYASRRRNVTLCEECWRKYWGWWKKYGYRADWVGWWSHCDGCGRHVRCNGFYPEEAINGAVAPQFWRDDYKKYASFQVVE